MGRTSVQTRVMVTVMVTVVRAARYCRAGFCFCCYHPLKTIKLDIKQQLVLAEGQGAFSCAIHHRDI